jgi:hypothetical protein
MQKGDFLGLAIVVVLLVGIALFFAYAPKAPPADIYAPVELTGSSITLGGKTGEQAITLSAEVKEPGFVSVHQAFGEAPGPVVGHSPLLTAGTHTDFTVETTEPLFPPNEYFLLLIKDDGDGIYEAGIDLPVMSGGEVVKQRLTL